MRSIVAASRIHAPKTRRTQHARARCLQIVAAIAALLAVDCKRRRGADAGAAGGALPPGTAAIQWTDTAVSFAGRDIGQPHSVFCPPNGVPGPVYGTDCYSLRSSICTAAVHAGRITLALGGIVQWYPWTEASRLLPSNHYGITSENALREQAFTFTPYVHRHQRLFFELTGRLPPAAIRPMGVVDALPYAPMAPAPTAIEATPIELSWTDNATRWRSEMMLIHMARCPARPASLRRVVFGTGTYSSDSAVCVAATHDGQIDATGGIVYIQMKGPQSSFSGSTQHGVTTRDWRRWPGSYSFLAAPRRVTIVPTGPAAATWETTASQLRGMNDTQVTYVCPPGGALEPIWGGGSGAPFSDDSSVCTAGVFAGAITFERGGPVQIRVVPGVNIFAGADQNNVNTGLGFGGPDRGGFQVVR